MNWTYKFAYEEMEEMLTSRPWLLVDDQMAASEAQDQQQVLDDFLHMQKELLLDRGWDWFRTAIRGRFFPKANVTTVTSWESEKNPQLGDPDPAIVKRVQNEFPGASVVSLIGQPHVVSGAEVPLEVLEAIKRQADVSRWKDQFIKTAATKPLSDDDFGEPYYKDEFQFEIADVDRYATDKYFANLTLQETDKLYSIGFQMYNFQVGITGAVLYWHYDKDEFARAKRTFKKAKTALKTVMRDIEYHRPPMAVITPMVRAVLQPIDVGKKERSGNYFYNWSELEAKEPDWRKSLYGKRYPAASIQPMDVAWNIDEEGKSIVSEGTSRSRVLRYKPSSPEHRKYAADMNSLRQLLSDTWKIPVGGAAGGVLAWLLSSGVPPAQLEQQLQQGATPQEIMTQVAPQNKQEVFDSEPSEIGTLISPEPELTQNPAISPDFSSEGVDNQPDKATIPRGIRNNNPGNIVHSDTAWQGMSEEQTDDRFITFDSPEHGIRAMARVLKNYGRQHNLRTVEEILSRWSPSSSNQTDAYIRHVSQELNLSPTAPLDLSNDELLTNLIQVMIKHENGAAPYDEETIRRGIALEKAGETCQKSIFRHSFQEMDWLKARSLVQRLTRQGLDWQQIARELIRIEVPKDFFGRLNGVHDIECSYAYAEGSSWRYAYDV